jgi:hypothetical protein
MTDNTVVTMADVHELLTQVGTEEHKEELLQTHEEVGEETDETLVKNEETHTVM